MKESSPSPWTKMVSPSIAWSAILLLTVTALVSGSYILQQNQAYDLAANTAKDTPTTPPLAQNLEMVEETPVDQEGEDPDLLEGEAVMAALASMGETEDFHPVVPHYSCGDVRRGQEIEVDPRTGNTSNQFERRYMVELRSFDCLWRAYRYVEKLRMATEDPAARQKIANEMQGALGWAGRALQKYQSNTVATLRKTKPDAYKIGHYSYAWGYPGNAIGGLYKAITYNPEFVKNNPDPEILAFLGAKLEIAKRRTGDVARVVRSNQRPTKSTGLLKDMEAFGVISNRMIFPPVTTTMVALLDEAQRLHTKWAQAVLEGMPANELQEIVAEHHRAHRSLESLSTTPDQQTLLTIPHHTQHLICWDRPRSELETLVKELDKDHAEWTAAVKVNNFGKAWEFGLKHSRNHILLSTCGIKLPEVPPFTRSK